MKEYPSVLSNGLCMKWSYMCHAQVLGCGVDKLFLYTLTPTFIQKRTENGN